MALMEWSSQFNTGIASIDAEHKVLMGFINDLHDGMMSGKGKSAMSPILAGLVSYTANHFKHEENVFDSIQYEHTEEHKEHHKNLVNQVLEFQKQFNDGDAAISNDLMTFLKEWLMTHIMKEDMKYTDLFKEKGIA